ncbi:DNA gyrase subunit A, partial [Streptococcus suis]
VVLSRCDIEQLNACKKEIVITDIPYVVNKAVLVKKIDDVGVNNKVPGIAEVRVESDRTCLRIAIELKKESDEQTILNYL